MCKQTSVDHAKLFSEFLNRVMIIVSGSRRGWDGLSRLEKPVLNDSFRSQRVENVQGCRTDFFAFVSPRSDYVPLGKAFHSSVAFDDEHSDVAFVVENETFRAHRNILARRCEFFHKMFTSGMRESTAETIPLDNISKADFSVLLHYLYTAEIEVEIPSVVKLYMAGDMFQLPKLQDTCVIAAKAKMTIEEAAVFLQQVHDENCHELKTFGLSFVRKHFDEVSTSSGMEVVTAELLLEIVKGFKLARA